VAALGHTGDLALIVEVVEALKDEVEWVFMGDIHPALKGVVRERHGFVPIERYPEALAALDLDLALAPLESNSFNEAKSHLKLIEYGVLGYPVVCSDVTAYQGDFPVTRVPNSGKAWIAAIRERVCEPAALAASGDRLRDHVLAHWLLEDRGDQWMAAWTR
jgi:O-antigen biosynthesis protein